LRMPTLTRSGSGLRTGVKACCYGVGG
jgi:hypothetical protein